jgi:DNA-binding MarR family transcriptional regulator
MRTTAEARSRIRRPAERGKADAGIFNSEDSLGHRLKLAHHAWGRHLDAALRPLGLTYLQYYALAAIEVFRERRETPSQVRIAAYLEVDAMMMSKILRLLEDRGYVTRSPHPGDPRANALSLTAAGSTLVRAASPVARAAHATFFDCRLDFDGKQALAALLARLQAPGTATN